MTQDAMESYKGEAKEVWAEEARGSSLRHET
jgi:hypothetical protein